MRGADLNQAKLKKYSIITLYIVDFIYIIFIRGFSFPYLLLNYLIISLILCVAYHSNVLAVIGNFYYATGKMELALKILDFAIKRKTKSPTAYLNYAIYLVRNFEGKKAMEYLNKSLSLKPQVLTEKNIYLTMGSCYWVLGDIDKAIEVLEGMRNKYEYVNAHVLTTLGFMYFLKEDIDTARELTEKAIEDSPEHGPAWDNLGQIHYKMGEIELAREAFEKAVEFKENLADSYYYLGLIAEDKNNKNKAGEYYQKALNCKITALNTISRNQVEERLTGVISAEG